MDILREMLVTGVVVPMGLSAVVLLAACVPWPRGRTLETRGWAGALALAAAYAAGHAGVAGGWPDFPPVDTTHWLCYLAVPTAIVAVAEELAEKRRWLVWPLRLVLIGALLWLLLRPVLENEWDRRQATVWLAGLGAGALGVWSAVTAFERRAPGAWTPLTLLLTATGTSVALGLSGSALYGQLAGVIAAALGPALLLALYPPTAGLARGALPVAVVLLAGLWISGHIYARLPAASALLLASPPLTAWVALWPRVRAMKPTPRGLIHMAAVVLPLAAAILLAIPEDTGYDYYDGAY